MEIITPEILTFDKGIAEISLDTLKRSASYELAKGSLPPTRPIAHHDIISEIADKATSINGITVKVDPILATERQSMRVMWAGSKEECPIQNYLIQRMTTRVQLISNTDTEFNMAVGISYHEKGISMAFGPNVWVCSNQNVFGDNIMHTYGNLNKVPFDKMMEIFGAWMQRFEEMRENDYSQITRMQERVVNENATQLLYGKLIDVAVQQNMDAKIAAPLNQTQVADFIRASHGEEYAVVDRETSVWDLQQRATSILKPHNNDMTAVLTNNNNFNKFLMNEFQLN